MSEKSKVEDIDHLKGLRIPSFDDCAARAVDCLGQGGVIDLSIAAHREKLRKALARSMSASLRWSIERSLKAAVSRAIGDTFRLAADRDYQKGKAESRDARARSEKRKKLAAVPPLEYVDPNARIQ